MSDDVRVLSEVVEWLDDCIFKPAGRVGTRVRCTRCKLSLPEPIKAPGFMRCEAGQKVTVGYAFWCPGCDEMHVFYTKACKARGEKHDTWIFNGDTKRPTFSPSLRVRSTPGDGRHQCHLHVENGQIKYCADCTHPFAGKTVPLPKWPYNVRTDETDKG